MVINLFRSRALRHGVSIPVLLATAAACQGCANSGGPREFFARLWNRDTIDHSVAVSPPAGDGADTSGQSPQNPILALLREKPAPEDPFLNRYDQVVFDRNQGETYAGGSRQADIQSGDLTAGEIAVGLERVSNPTLEHDATPLPPRPPADTAVGHRAVEQHAAAPFRNPFARKPAAASRAAAAPQASPAGGTSQVKAPPVGAQLDAELARLQSMVNSRPQTTTHTADNAPQQRAARLRIDELMETSRELAESGEYRDAYYVALEAQELQQQTGVVFEFGTQSPSDLVAGLRTKLHAETPVVEISLFGDSATTEQSEAAEESGSDATVDTPSFAQKTQASPGEFAGPAFAAPDFGSRSEEAAETVPDPAGLETPIEEEIAFRPPTDFLRGPEVADVAAPEAPSPKPAESPATEDEPELDPAFRIPETGDVASDNAADFPAAVKTVATPEPVNPIADEPVADEPAEVNPFAVTGADPTGAAELNPEPGRESGSVEVVQGPAPFPDLTEPVVSDAPPATEENPFRFPGLADRDHDRVELLDPAPQNPAPGPEVATAPVQIAETLPQLHPGVPARTISTQTTSTADVAPLTRSVAPGAPGSGLPVIPPRWSQPVVTSITNRGSLVMPQVATPAPVDPESVPPAVLPSPVQTAEIPGEKPLQLPSAPETVTDEQEGVAFSEGVWPTAESEGTFIAADEPQAEEKVSPVPTLMTPTFEGAPGEKHLATRRKDASSSSGPPLLVAPNSGGASDALVSHSRTFLPLRRNEVEDEQAELKPTTLEAIDWAHETESRASASTPWFRHPLVIIGALALVAVGISVRMHRRGVLTPQTERARVIKWPFKNRTADDTAEEDSTPRRKSA